MTVTCKHVLEALESIAPHKLAEEGDNCGLLVGDPCTEVQGIMLCLDVTEAVVEEALEKDINLVISHHPLIFKPLKNLRFDTPEGQLLKKIIQNELSIIALHTNWDNAQSGVNMQLAQMLGLQEINVLQPKALEQLYKLAVFVPQEYEAQVREVLGASGAGHIGSYSHCAFRIPGTGTFLPLAGTNPFIGSQGRLEEVEEYRLETIVPESLLPQVLNAMLAAHPYEEVAYDLYPLANQAPNHGLGRIGKLTESMPFRQFAEQVKSKLAVDALRLAGKHNKIISTVAVCGGSGKSLIGAAASAGADVLVTGELGYHDAQLADNLDIALIDAGHFATEIISLPFLASKLQREFGAQQFDIFVAVAGTERDPWQIV